MTHSLRSWIALNHVIAVGAAGTEYESAVAAMVLPREEPKVSLARVTFDDTFVWNPRHTNALRPRLERRK